MNRRQPVYGKDSGVVRIYRSETHEGGTVTFAGGVRIQMPKQSGH